MDVIIHVHKKTMVIIPKLEWLSAIAMPTHIKHAVRNLTHSVLFISVDRKGSGYGLLPATSHNEINNF